jgi:ubiquinone/menaquinone biosynthesis C-methylase UbiE
VDHADHVNLLRPAVAPGETWADIGAGTGAFTLALAELVGPDGRIVAADRDRGGLSQNAAAVTSRFPGVALRTLVGDFTARMDLPLLDGLVAANSLHFVARDRQVEVVRRLVAHLRPGGTIVVVEYDTDHGNPWVPHPFRYESWVEIATEAGLAGISRIGRVPSRFLGAIYSAAAVRP